MKGLFAQHRYFTTPRRAAAVLLALVLNATVVPCAMALEADDDAHDCCPPEIRLNDAAACCVIDDVTHDTRSTRLFLDDDGGADALLSMACIDVVVPADLCDAEATGPPRPPSPAVPVYKLNCVYLK